jgi:thiol-disulfide isomerase/thioredoxin
LKDEAGKSYTLEQLLKGKKYLLIDFWASWCAPCRKEIPNVKKNYEQYKNHGFEVVSISIDQNAAAWKKAVQQEQLKWPNFLSPAVANQFKVRAVPTMYLIDANGVVLGINEDVRGEALGKKLAELFK